MLQLHRRMPLPRALGRAGRPGAFAGHVGHSLCLELAVEVGEVVDLAALRCSLLYTSRFPGNEFKVPLLGHETR